jgi:PAS domain S-box-containing protein
MAVIVATPVIKDGEVIGSIITGDLLNGDLYLAKELQDIIAEAKVALIQDGVVVSALPEGPLGLGEMLPEDVLKNLVPGTSKTWVQLNGEEWLLTAEAIRDNQGNSLGAVVIGAPRAVFFAHVEELKRSLAFTAILALAFALLLALISTEELTSPIMNLAEAAKRIRKGELGFTVETGRLSSRDELGELTQAFNTMSIELKKSYIGLKEALEYNQSIITNAPMGIFTTDRKGRITSANPKHMEMMGWENEEQGLGLDLFSIPSIREKGWDKLLRKALRGEPVELYHEEYTSVFGKEMCINLKAVPLKKNGEIQGLLVLVEDITERMKAEERVKELSQFPERNPNPVLKADISGEILYYNPGVFNYVKTVDELTELLPQDYVSLVKTACATGKEIRVDHRYNGKFLDYVIYPVSSRAAHIHGRDITERKNYEEELKKRIKELERMHRIMVGRELRMKELKEKIKELEKELGRGNG